jgi:hypothetical protein
MWETTFPRNSHAGLGKPLYEPDILVSMKHFRKVPTQSGVAISRKCCFPHGFLPLVKMGMKTLDKNIDKKTSNDLGRKTHPDTMKMDIRVD